MHIGYLYGFQKKLLVAAILVVIAALAIGAMLILPSDSNSEIVEANQARQLADTFVGHINSQRPDEGYAMIVDPRIDPASWQIWTETFDNDDVTISEIHSEQSGESPDTYTVLYSLSKGPNYLSVQLAYIDEAWQITGFGIVS